MGAFSSACFPNRYCKWPFLAGENLKVAGDIAGHRHILTNLNAATNVPRRVTRVLPGNSTDLTTCLAMAQGKFQEKYNMALKEPRHGFVSLKI